MTDNKALFQERIDRVNDGIALKETDRVPCTPFFAGYPYFRMKNGTTYKDSMYNYPKATEAWLKLFEDYPLCDAHTAIKYTSGKANESAQTNIIDWPGRPGTIVHDESTHQVYEREYMTADEYPELLNDYSGFITRKFIPRVYPALKGLASLSFNPASVLSTTPLRGYYSPEALEAYKTLGEIAKHDSEATAAGADLNAKLCAMGMPTLLSGGGEAPFDVLSDYFRGTMGTFDDLIERPDMIAEACDLFVDIQIAGFQYLRGPLPVKRVFFPLHKGMDGFISPKQYETLYWKPFLKLVYALVDMGVTPYIYSEGKYNTRLEQMTDLPKGKTLIHFEEVDMAKAKKVLGGTACICGNMPIYLLQHGTKQKVVDYMKYLMDTCAPGGGYIFDADGSIDHAKDENIDAMFNILETYGKY